MKQKKKKKTSPYIKIDTLLIPVLLTWGPARPILPEAQRLGLYLGPLALSIIYQPAQRGLSSRQQAWCQLGGSCFVFSLVGWAPPQGAAARLLGWMGG